MDIFIWLIADSPKEQKSADIHLKLSEFGILAIIPFIVLFVFTSCHKNEIVKEKVGMPQIWETLLPAEVYYGSPALSTDEKTVYIGTSKWFTAAHDEGNVFVALDAATGNRKWKLDLGTSEVRSSPAIAPDNSIYFAVEVHDPSTGIIIGDELWHVSSGGNFLWNYDINPSRLTLEVGQSVPAIGQDGTVYVGGDKLYAINSDGSERWSTFDFGVEVLRNAPVIGEDGTVYFVFHNIPLTALNPENGEIKWSCPLGVNDHCLASPAIGDDGRIYVATQPGIVYAVSSTGQLEWTFDLSSVGFIGILRSSPAIGNDGSIYFGINTGNPVSAFFALNHDGTLKWKFEPSDLPDDVPATHFDIYSSPAIGSDNAVYFGQEFGRVYALKCANGSLINITEVHSGITWSSPALDSKGILYISDLSGTVFAFQTGSDGLDPLAEWPKFRYDNQNAGKKY
jgi:outer membrane protein assembly factor BamB